MPEIRVLIADDQKLLRQSLAHLLDAQPGFRVVAEAATGVEAVSLARELVPDRGDPFHRPRPTSVRSPCAGADHVRPG